MAPNKKMATNRASHASHSDDLNEQVDQLDRQIAQLEAKRKKTLAAAQKQCKHPIKSIVEGEYVSDYEFSRPPFRVCTKCGYAEEGWHCGYYRLHDEVFEVPRMNREAAWKYVKKFWSQDELAKIRFGR